MKPFRTSLTARIVSLSIAFALTGGGLIPILGLTPAIALPAVILLAVAGCIVGCILGAQEHTWSVAALAIMLPLALWPYTLVLMLVATRFGEYGWALVAAGALMTGATAIASFTTRPSAEKAPAAQHAAAG
jgi:hypothetical protein